MGKAKEFFKSLIPPIFLDLIRKDTSHLSPKKAVNWSGPLTNWEDAIKSYGGYDSSQILETCKNSLLKVKNGEAVYERDSVLFDKIEYSWPIVAGLLRASIENRGTLNVLDFGGSLGSSYFQNRGILQKSIDQFSWSIVEQSHFVDCGKENFQNEELKFFPTIDSCLQERYCNVLLLSSVLQYLESPLDFLKSLFQYNFPYILIDRTTVTPWQDSQLMLQTISEEIYPAQYPCWFISESQLLDLVSKKYQVISDFESYCDGPSQIFDQVPVSWKGYILELKG